MAFRRKRRHSDTDPFTDLLFNALLGFTFMFLIAVFFLNPPTQTGEIPAKAEYIVTATWESGPAGTCNPVWAITTRSPVVLRATVLPPVFGPVMMSAPVGGMTLMSTGTGPCSVLSVLAAVVLAGRVRRRI